MAVQFLQFQYRFIGYFIAVIHRLKFGTNYYLTECVRTAGYHGIAEHIVKGLEKDHDLALDVPKDQGPTDHPGNLHPPPDQ